MSTAEYIAQLKREYEATRERMGALAKTFAAA
jgi:hypothetical protein